MDNITQKTSDFAGNEPRCVEAFEHIKAQILSH